MFYYPKVYSSMVYRLWLISLLLHRLPRLPSQCDSNEPGNLGNQGSNKEIQPTLEGQKPLDEVTLEPDAGQFHYGLIYKKSHAYAHVQLYSLDTTLRTLPVLLGCI